MKVRTITLKILFFVFTLIFIAGCGGDDEKNDYATVSNMIADRNKARLNQAAQKKSPSKKLTENEASLPADISKTQTETQKPQIMTFEEEVRIVSESSGKTVAVGTAYLDKSGKIINIRIKNR